MQKNPTPSYLTANKKPMIFVTNTKICNNKQFMIKSLYKAEKFIRVIYSKKS